MLAGLNILEAYLEEIGQREGCQLLSSADDGTFSRVRVGPSQKHLNVIFEEIREVRSKWDVIKLV